MDSYLPMALTIAVIVVIVVVMTWEVDNNVYAPRRIKFDLAAVMLAAISMCRSVGRGAMPAAVPGADSNRRMAVFARCEQWYCTDHNERQEEQESSFHSECLIQLNKSTSSEIAHLTIVIDQGQGAFYT